MSGPRDERLEKLATGPSLTEPPTPVAQPPVRPRNPINSPPPRPKGK